MPFTWSLLVTLSTFGDSLEVRYVGNAGFELYDGTTTLLIDLPYRSGAFDLMSYDPSNIQARGRVVSVITHRDVDHFAPELFAPKAWLIYGPHEVTTSLPSDRVLGDDHRPLGKFEVERFRTRHRDTEHYSYLITWRGRRLYFVGDTDDPSHLLSMRDLDVLFITPWLTCAVEKAGGSVGARRVVLHHQFPDRRLKVCGSPEVIPQGAQWTIPPVDRTPGGAG